MMALRRGTLLSSWMVMGDGPSVVYCRALLGTGKV